MSEYTPPTEDVRNHYAYGCGPEHTWAESREDFDRWLAQVRREAAAEALEDAADYARVLTGEPAHYDRNVVLHDGGPGAPVTETLSGWLTRRAEQFREGR
jgi:hypothetical protein